MTWPAPATLLRHRPPALLVDRIVARTADTLACEAEARAWDWPALLEGCAQTAGLLAGMQDGGPGNTALIAEYRDVTVHRPAYDGAVRFQARMIRRLFGFWQHDTTAHGADGALLLAGRVTVAAAEPS